MADNTDKRREIEEKLGLEPGEEIDPELVELANEQRSQSVLRPILFIAVIALGVWIISDWWPELRYFFKSGEPTQIGEVGDFASKRGDDPDWSPDLPDNEYVSLSGVPSRRSSSPKYEYFKLIGANIYVEKPREETGDSEGVERRRSFKSPDRVRFEGAGRMLSFGSVPERYQGVRDYYHKTYGTRFCGLITDREQSRLRKLRRESIIQTWREDYENATEEERDEQGLTPKPSDEEIEELMGADPVCVDGYLLRAGVTPKDHWWYLLITGMFGIFMLVNAYWLVRWFVHFFGSGPIPELEERESGESQ